MEFGFDAIQHAATASHGKSRFASSTSADQLSGSPHRTSKDECSGALDRNADWMDDLEATPSTSLSADEEAAEQQSGLQDTCIAEVSAASATELLSALNDVNLLQKRPHHVQIVPE